jgi:hypothetical protein
MLEQASPSRGVVQATLNDEPATDEPDAVALVAQRACDRAQQASGVTRLRLHRGCARRSPLAPA